MMKYNFKQFKLAILSSIMMMLLFVAAGSYRAAAQINPSLKFQGKVTNTDGTELADNTYDFDFALYAQPTGGAPIWSETMDAANMFSATVSGVTQNADSITYQYNADTNETTLQLGQTLNMGADYGLIIDFDTTGDTVTVASGSPLWAIGDAVNNRPYVTGGVIDVNLGAVSSLAGINFNQTLYLEVIFDGETMQPRKVITAQAQAFEAASLGGHAASEFASLVDNETVTGSWTFDNILDINATSSVAALSITQAGTGRIVDIRNSATTTFAVLADGRVQIGNYYLPATAGLAGQVLKTDAFGNVSWQNDSYGAGGSGSSFWATSTDELLIHPSFSTYSVVIGNTATTADGYIFEVFGSSLFDNIRVDGNITVSGTVDGVDISSLGAYMIGTEGTYGQLWMSDGSGPGTWIATSSLNINLANTIGTLPIARGGTNWDSTGANGVAVIDAGAWSASSTLSAYRGGTGLSSYAPGDLIYAISAQTLGTRSIGTNGQIMMVAGGLPAWTATSSLGYALAAHTHASLTAGTGLSAFTYDGSGAATVGLSNSGVTAGNYARGSFTVDATGRVTEASTSLINLAGEVTGLLGNTLGGTGQNSSAWTGFAYVDAGAWSASSTLGLNALPSSVMAEGENISLLNNNVNYIMLGSLFADSPLSYNSGTGHFSVGAGYAIPASSDIIDWDAAYGWGDHAAENYFDLDSAPLNVQYGGTGSTTLAAYGLIYGNGTSAVGTTGRGANGLVLQSIGGVPTWVATTSLGIDLSAMAGALLVEKGGTGTTTLAANGILFSPAANTVSQILAGTDGLVLKMVGGVPQWAVDSISDGAAGLWSTSTDNQLLYPTSALHAVVIGDTGTTAPGYIFEVEGSSYLDDLYINGNITAGTWQGSAIANTYGGTGVNSSAWTGFPYVSGGTWSASTTIGLDSLPGTIVTEGENITLLANNANYISLGSLSAVSPLSYNSGAGQFSLVAGYSIPLVASTTNWNSAYDTVNANSANWNNAYNAVNANSADWTTAYNWGDHAAAGYFSTTTDQVLSVIYGGTGTTTLAANGILFSPSANTVSQILPGTDGLVLKMVGGVPQWASDLTASGAAGLWSTSTDNQILHPYSALHAVVIGDTGTSAPGYMFEVEGSSYLDDVYINGNITAGTWQGSAIANAYGGTGVNSSAWTGIAAVAGGTWSATTSIGADLLAADVMLAGEGVSLLDNDANYITLASLSSDSAILTYNNTNGHFDIASGYAIPRTASSTNWNNAYDAVTASSSNWEAAYNWGDHAGQNYFDKDTDILTVAKGGTGTSTAPTEGALLYGNAAGGWSYLATGTNGYVLSIQGNTPTWISASAVTTVHNILDAAVHSDVTTTGSLTKGDLLYYNGTNWTNAATNTLGLLTTYVDEGTNLYYTDARARGAISITPSQGLSYNSGTGIISVDGSYDIPLTASTSNWETAYLWGNHAVQNYFDLDSAPLAVAEGGTGGATAEEARFNMGLNDIYKFGITSTGTTGFIWQSDGDGAGQWVAASSITAAEPAFIGTTTATTNGSFSYSGKRGYQAANDICNSEYAGSHFCRTNEILGTIIQEDISSWGLDTDSAWIAEGPPGYTYNSNDCMGYATSSSLALGAFWLFNSDGGGAGWLVNCGTVKSLACCE